MWYAVILAGGVGARMGANVNKVLLPLGGKPVLLRSVEAFIPHVSGIVVVTRPQDRDVIVRMLRKTEANIVFADAGSDRQASVASGLSALPPECTHVMIHDGARCLVDEITIRNVMKGTMRRGAAVAAIPVTDTIKSVNDDSVVTSTPVRSTLRAVQTPQGFSRQLLQEAHHFADASGYRGTDDASLVEYYGRTVILTEGNRRNIKLTTPEDMIMAESWTNGMQFPAPPDIRIGQGYDVHKLVADRKLILCGVEIPHTVGLLGHSDADVAVHALMDAMLGAAALGDIGRHFPDTDPKYSGISSMVLLQHVTDLLAENGFFLANADVTIVAQRPKLLPYIEQMRMNIARTICIPVERINVKATTTEGLGFEGEQTGISAQAVCLLVKK